MLSLRTTPDVMSSSAKSNTSMPSSSCFLNWIPELVSRSMESWAYMSSLVNEQNNTYYSVKPLILYLRHIGGRIICCHCILIKKYIYILREVLSGPFWPISLAIETISKFVGLRRRSKSMFILTHVTNQETYHDDKSAQQCLTRIFCVHMIRLINVRTRQRFDRSSITAHRVNFDKPLERLPQVRCQELDIYIDITDTEQFDNWYGFSISIGNTKKVKNKTYVRLNLKLNCHVEALGGGMPFSSMNVSPTWMIFSRSTLHLSRWYW